MSAAKPFVLAVPSKGRLQENAFAFFARAGLKLVQGGGSRDYRGRLAGFDGLEVAFLPVSEIVAHVADGSAHLGVAGEDVLREAIPDADRAVAFLSKLGFGHADVVVAVPRAWIDVRTVADLEDVAATFHARRGRRMRVATKYVNLTRRFFAERGVTDYRIVESLGATEGAPAAGGAELIVDITTTGATLAANALKVLDDGVMLRSEANLVASLAADWSEAHRRTARALLGRIAAEERARTTRELRAAFAGWRAGARAGRAGGLRRDGGRPRATGGSCCTARRRACRTRRLADRAGRRRGGGGAARLRVRGAQPAVRGAVARLG